MTTEATSALAVAVFGALLAHQATFMQGLRTSLLIAAGVALAAAAVSLLLRTTPLASAAAAHPGTRARARADRDEAWTATC